MVSNQSAISTPKAKAVAAPRKRPTKAEKLAASADATAQTPRMASEPEHNITTEQRQADRRADDVVRNDAFSKFVADANPENEAAKQAAFAADLEALKIKHNVTTDVIVKAPKANKVMQNGITRPAEGTTCGKIWSLADEISARNHTVAAVASIREHASMKEVNDHTIKTQYAKWRKFHGIAGRLPTIHAVHQEAGPAYDDLTPHIAGTPVQPVAKDKE